MPPASTQVHPAEVWHVQLRPGDLLFVRGSAWISRQILSATRGRGEPPTQVSHVGLVDGFGTIEEAEILEAVGKVRRTTIAAAYARAGGELASGIAIARCSSLTDMELGQIRAISRTMEGRSYGWGKIGLQLLDSWTGRLARRERTPVLFRRLSISPWPICSVHVARAFRAAGIEFGLRDRYATPDDLHDAVLNHRTGRVWTWPIGPKLAAIPPH